MCATAAATISQRLLFASAATGHASLIPSAPVPTFNYFNTWHSQYSLAAHHLGAKDFSAMMGDAGSVLSQKELTEENLFGPKGLVHTAYPTIRQDMYFVLDHGWDNPPSGDLAYTGTLDLNAERFPSFKGNPAQKLKTLCAAIKKAGWRGTGIWIPAQLAPVTLDRDKQKGINVVSPEYRRNHWIKSLRESHEAGIAYWKVDWGTHAHEPVFREMLYALAKEHAPGLVLETTEPRGPLNNQITQCACPDSQEAKKDRKWLDISHRLMKMPGTFRIYDTITFTAVPTTLARIAGLLNVQPDDEAKAFLNCEDEVYIGAALGIDLAIQRNALPGVRYVADPSPRNIAHKINEAVRAVRWQRIAPPVAAGKTSLAFDPKLLWDSWKYSEGQTWLRSAIGKEIWQGAPARIARGMQLPHVTTEGTPPFVVSSRHPNGATAVATLGRISSARGWMTPHTNVAIEGCSLDAPVGIFGVYEELALDFDAPINKRRVLMQDLATDTPIDVTKQVQRIGKRIIMPGKLIDELCAVKDQSEPGVVLQCI
ncbi:MAG: hypothetical protein JSS87_03765 [Acidobacteria bacterium]|nr:hypothetical protein [Acidobacteriota bacterium]